MYLLGNKLLDFALAMLCCGRTKKVRIDSMIRQCLLLIMSSIPHGTPYIAIQGPVVQLTMHVGVQQENRCVIITLLILKWSAIRPFRGVSKQSWADKLARAFSCMMLRSAEQ